MPYNIIQSTPFRSCFAKPVTMPPKHKHQQESGSHSSWTSKSSKSPKASQAVAADSSPPAAPSALQAPTEVQELLCHSCWLHLLQCWASMFTSSLGTHQPWGRSQHRLGHIQGQLPLLHADPLLVLRQGLLPSLYPQGMGTL